MSTFGDDFADFLDFRIFADFFGHIKLDLAERRLLCYLMDFRHHARAGAAGRGHALRFTYEMRHLKHGKEDRTQNGPGARFNPRSKWAAKKPETTIIKRRRTSALAPEGGYGVGGAAGPASRRE